MSLLESLVAAAVFAASTLAVAELERSLRLGGDIARERSEALRLGSEHLEQWRAFATLDAASSAHSFAAMADGALTIGAASAPSAHAVYRVARHVDDASAESGKAVSVSVQWSDRVGAAHDVVLHSFIAGAAPQLGGALGLSAGAIVAMPRAVGGRAPGVPATAQTLGHGRSVWKPIESGTTALVFDDRSGDVVGRCDGIATATRTRNLGDRDLAVCTTGRWLAVSGTIRFATVTPLAANIAVSLDPRAADGPPPTCFSEARKTVRYSDGAGWHIADVALDALPASRDVATWDDTGDRFVSWHCLVPPRADGTWSGRISLAGNGWAIGTSADARRVCRQTSGGPIDANIAHPAEYRDVAGALVAQDFLVVRGSERCPSYGTVQHQP